MDEEEEREGLKDQSGAIEQPERDDSVHAHIIANLVMPGELMPVEQADQHIAE